MTSPDRRTFLAGTFGAAVIAIEPELLALPPRLAAPVRVGIVGTGRQARAILAELGKFEDVAVAALCDVDDSRLRAAGRRAPEAQAFATHAELLSGSELDAVVVSTPTHLHRAVALDALAAKKHVYCEAPLASTLEDCRAIAAAARASEKVFQTGMQARANPVYQLARTFYRAGDIRDALALRAQYHKKDSWRTAARDAADEKALNWKLDPEVSLGLLGELGAQQFDVFHWFTDQYPTAVRARGAVLAWNDGREVPDTVHCELEFPGGATLVYEATLGNSFEGQCELLLGTLGTIKLAWSHAWMFKEADAPTMGWQVYANRQKFHNDEGITLIAGATQLAEQGKLKEGVGLPHPALYYSLEAFLKSVTAGEEVVSSADEGLRAALVAIKAHEALRNGSSVEIDPELYRVDAR